MLLFVYVRVCDCGVHRNDAVCERPYQWLVLAGMRKASMVGVLMRVCERCEVQTIITIVYRLDGWTLCACVFFCVTYRNDDVCKRPDQGLGLVGYAKGEYGGCFNTCVRKWCGSNKNNDRVQTRWVNVTCVCVVLYTGITVYTKDQTRD